MHWSSNSQSRRNRIKNRKTCRQQNVLCLPEILLQSMEEDVRCPNRVTQNATHRSNGGPTTATLAIARFGSLKSP